MRENFVSGLKNIFSTSILVRIINAIFGWFDRQTANSRIMSAFLSPVKSGPESTKTSVFWKMWLIFRRFISFVYEKLHLEKILSGSIFLRTYFWCAAAVVAAPIFPTSAVIAFAAIGTVSLLLDLAANKERELIYSPINKYIFVLMIVYIFAVVTSLTFLEGFFGGVVYLMIILFSIILYNVLTNEKGLYLMLDLMAVAGFFVACCGISQYLLGHVGSMNWIDTTMFGEATRVYATLQNPNVLAEYLVLIIPVTVALFFKADNNKMRLAYAIAAAAMCVCMVLTLSRGGWLGLLVAAAMFLVIMDKRFVLLGIVGLIALYFVLPESVIARFTSIGDMGDTSTAYRVYIWIGTIHMLSDYWLGGVGFGMPAFLKVYPAYAYHAVSAPHAHNLFLQVMCDSGIVGFGVYAIIVFLFYKTTCIAITKTTDKKLKYVLIGCVSAVTGFMVQSLTDYTFYNYRVMLFFWAVLIIGMAAARLSSKNDFAANKGEN